MEMPILACLLTALFALCSAIAGCIAYQKRRSPHEGVLLGLLLGPIGVIVASKLPYLQRPPVDENAWNSLHSMMTYQQKVYKTRHRSSTAD